MFFELVPPRDAKGFKPHPQNGVVFKISDKHSRPPDLRTSFLSLPCNDIDIYIANNLVPTNNLKPNIPWTKEKRTSTYEQITLHDFTSP